VADGKVEEFKGDLDEYAAWLRSRSSGSTEQGKGKRAAA
jgi:ATP-binding cassette subfamily F protein 3